MHRIGAASLLFVSSGTSAERSTGQYLGSQVSRSPYRSTIFVYKICLHNSLIRLELLVSVLAAATITGLELSALDMARNSVALVAAAVGPALAFPTQVSRLISSLVIVSVFLVSEVLASRSLILKPSSD